MEYLGGESLETPTPKQVDGQVNACLSVDCWSVCMHVCDSVCDLYVLIRMRIMLVRC